MAKKSRGPQTPVTVTEQHTNPRTGKVEVWAAVSVDGQWQYNRLELTGTPWDTIYVPTGQGYWFGSLPEARAATASGLALHLIEQNEGANA